MEGGLEPLHLESGMTLMALDQRKRQKNAEKRKAKQKARQKALVGQQRDELSSQLKRTATAPILHCCVQEELWSGGMGQLLLSRKLPNGDVAFAVYLLDVYCLGCKDATVGVLSWISYQEKIANGLLKQFTFVDLTPEGARKIVEGAVAYARDLGIPPHADYLKAQLLFGNIDASICEDEFVYGLDGKPYFVSGPYDSPMRCRQIMTLLKNKVGPDGYHFMAPVDDGYDEGGELLEYDEDDFDDEFDDE